ncbi:not available [Yersinia enterocolitica]|nr:not available [Yersinia enterocolitica]
MKQKNKFKNSEKNINAVRKKCISLISLVSNTLIE